MSWYSDPFGGGQDWGGAAQGAAGGALAGSAFGGPLGAIGGGVIGGAMGLWGSGGGNPYDAQMQAWANGQGNPTAAQGQLSQFRGNQAHLISALEAQARGEGPSLAAQQLQAATDRNTKQSQALAAGASGPNAALAQFQAQQGNQALGAQAAQDAALMRIQEQYNAQNQLGLTLHGARGMDESMSQFNAGAKNDMAQFNRNSQYGALSQMWGNEAGKPSMGEQIMGAGAGLYAFKAGQQGNQPQGAQARSVPGGYNGPTPAGTVNGLYGATPAGMAFGRAPNPGTGGQLVNPWAQPSGVQGSMGGQQLVNPWPTGPGFQMPGQGGTPLPRQQAPQGFWGAGQYTGEGMGY